MGIISKTGHLYFFHGTFFEKKIYPISSFKSHLNFGGVSLPKVAIYFPLNHVSSGENHNNLRNKFYYSKTAMARTLMARLPRLFRTRFFESLGKIP